MKARAVAIATAILTTLAVAIGLFFTGHSLAIELPKKEVRGAAKKAPASKGPPIAAPRKLLPNPPGAGPQRNPTAPVVTRSGPNPGAVTNNAARPKPGDPKVGSSKVGNPTLGNPKLGAPSVGDPRANNSKSGNARIENSKFGGSKIGIAKGGSANAAATNSIGPRNTPPGNIRTAPSTANIGDARRRAVNAATPAERQVQRLRHRADLFAARSRLPPRPLPGERNFTGVPPSGETRFVSTDVVLQVGPNVSPQAIDAMARRFGLSAVDTQRSALTGGTMVHFRVAGGRAVGDVIRAMEAERAGIAQPNYVYRLSQNETAAASSATGGTEQYVLTKLRLAEAHQIATGKGVLIAVIDSTIDRNHPDLADAVVSKLDAAGRGEKPHTHGTGMVGAIVAHGRLKGVAPDARVLAVHAFSASGQQSPQATTRNIIAGLDWALARGARIINMSFAGPYDPMLQLAMKKAHEKGAVLIAAAGNLGPNSPPLYPAADPHVIAVTATDENDQPFSGANRGPHVAVAAPGVDVLAAAPSETYQLTTGTSVAAAHASGVAALLIERRPTIDAKTVLEVLTASATKLNGDKRDDQSGWGLIDPVAALEELDARMADGKVAAPAKPALPRQGAALPR